MNATVQVRSDVAWGLNQVVSNEDGENWPGTGYIMMVDP